MSATIVDSADRERTLTATITHVIPVDRTGRSFRRCDGSRRRNERASCPALPK